MTTDRDYAPKRWLRETAPSRRRTRIAFALIAAFYLGLLVGEL